MQPVDRMKTVRAAAWGLALLGTLVLLPSRVAGQGVTTGSIRGQVTDSAGRPLPRALVVATNSGTGFRRDAVADEDGLYTLSYLPPGEYAVRVQLVGYRPREASGVRVALGERTTVNARLGAVGIQLEAIAVRADAAGVDVTDGSVTQLVTQEEIEALPSLGRDFSDFIRLSGLVAPNPEETTGGKFSIAGQRPSQTNVQIDGVDANNGFFGENRGGSRIPFSFSLESIREFQIITNGFDVEYGGYSGGVVNVVTRGGTNRFQGTAYANLRSDVFTASDFAGNPATDYEVLQYAARVSGSLKRDRAFFLLSLDGQRRREPETPISQSHFLNLRDAAGNLAPDSASADSLAQFVTILENQYGIAGPGDGYRSFQTSNDVLTLFARLDWTLSPNHSLSLRHNYSDYTNDNEWDANFDFIYGRSRAERLEDVAHSFVGELQSVLGPRTFNVFRFQYASERRPRTGHELRPALIVSLGTGQQAGYGGTFAAFQNRLEERKVQLIDNLTRSMGRHTVKLGGNAIFTNLENQFILQGAGEYRFSNLADFEAYRPSSFVRNVRSDGRIPLAAFGIAEWALYAQDEWQVTPRLTATAGLRYDVQSYLDDPARVVDVEAAFGVRSGVAPVDDDNVSPRLMLAYDPRGDGRSVLRAGAGYFYGRVPYVLGGNVQSTVLPVLTLTCSGSIAAGDPDAPPDLSGYGGWSPGGEINPTACAGAGGVGGVPTYTFWNTGFEYPETFKANLGYERDLGDRTRVSLDLVYSRSTKLYTVRNLNLRDPQFVLDNEGGRRVFQPEAGFDPSGTSTNQLRNLEFGDVFVNYNDGLARSLAITFEASHRFGDRTTVRGSYTYVRARDNSSYSCCTASSGYTNPNVGAFGPNEIGGAGDEDRAWGSSDFARNHTVVLELIARLPLDVRFSGFLRYQGGNPWTPEQSGDLNGDGIRFNDRPFVFRPEDLPLATTDSAQGAAERAQYASYLAAYRCVGDYVGRIVPRNTCRFGRQTRFDVRLSKGLNTGRGHRAEIQLDLFNVLNGIGRLVDRPQWGDYQGVFAANRNLLAPQSYDAATGQIRYSVPTTFGKSQPIGANLLLQFQAQLGLRYTF
ncbi:MAG: TonB-dependent receptor [Gemmatimonadales bacterium]|nr:TonB-dependent receptor [Gemmatimonadales bacterium]